MRTRPFGITLLAALSVVGAAFDLLLLALAILRPDLLAAVLKALSPGGSGPEMQLKFAGVLPFYYAFTFALSVAIAVGFWKLQNWARYVVLVLIGLSFLGVLAGAPGAFRAATAGAIALSLVRTALCVLVGGYLLSTKVRAAFGRRAQSGAAA